MQTNSDIAVSEMTTQLTNDLAAAGLVVTPVPVSTAAAQETVNITMSSFSIPAPKSEYPLDATFRLFITEQFARLRRMHEEDFLRLAFLRLGMEQKPVSEVAIGKGDVGFLRDFRKGETVATMRMFETLSLAVVKAAKAASNQFAFEQYVLNVWSATRAQARSLYKIIRAHLAPQGKWVMPASRLARQMEVVEEKKLEKADAAEIGVAKKQQGVAAAAVPAGSLVQVAQRVARELGKNGPVSMDDVAFSMGSAALPKPGTKHNWKGSVFGGSEWACVGTVPSRMVGGHARRIKLWALKSWLNTNTLNGRPEVTSSFSLHSTYSDFKRLHPTLDLTRCAWYIGDEQLADSVRQTIVAGNNQLYQIPVNFMPGAVGAVLMPPDYIRAAFLSRKKVQTGDKVPPVTKP